MPGLELLDTIVLKEDRKLTGTIERTHYEGHDQPLEDCLIIAHVTVDSDALSQFVKSGIPPKDHVFVRFASSKKSGHSLVHEDQVELLDRSFTLGDVVKREGSHMLGWVVDLTETFALRPVWRSCPSYPLVGLSVLPADDPAGYPAHTCSSACPGGPPSSAVSHPLPSDLIYNVPGRELKKAEDVLEGDYVILDDWLGVVEELDLLVTILLEDDSIVVVQNADGLYASIEDSHKPVVSLPEFDEGFRRPDFIVAQQGWSATVPLPPYDFPSAQMVVTDHRNLQNGRWLRGSFNRNIPAQGRIIDVRAKTILVRWLTCNAYVSTEMGQDEPPSSQVSLYDNINTFPNRSELRRNKKVIIVDSTKMPRRFEDRRRNKSNFEEHTHVASATDIRVGDHVKFRDAAGAAVKYQGIIFEETVHGKFSRLPPAAMFGFNLSELKVVHTCQQVTVMWQDGTVEGQLSSTLRRFPLFETDMAPSDIVVAREGLQQRPATTPNGAWVVFNEMTFFEQPQDLKVGRVGIIQNVDPAGRVAQVRWFSNPAVRLLNFGHILSGESRFGALSSAIEDVSLYEVMTFPALTRKLKDLIVIVPSVPSTKGASEVADIPLQDTLETGTAILSSLNPYDRLAWLQTVARAQTADLPTIPSGLAQTRRSRSSLDWIGEIVKIGLNGVLTVRVDQGNGTYQDVLLEHDQILCLVDEAAIGGDGAHETGSDSMDMDDPYSNHVHSIYSSSHDSLISERVEYEGGQRLDDDSGDDNWEDETEPESLGQQEDEEMIDSSIFQARPESVSFSSEQSNAQGMISETVSKGKYSVVADALTLLRNSLTKQPPPAFAVLESEPPADQFKSSKISSSGAILALKRIAREHGILKSSLPAGKIYVRTYENRLDLLRCLIIGPVDTAYEYAPFLFDLHLGPKFPREPPVAHFHSWTSGLGRINPNLYEEGKICLSLLGTWQGKSETEGWNENSTILQLLVSLQGLVFVQRPFYNEAGFEGYAEDNEYRTESDRYTEKAFIMARGFVRHAIERPVTGLEDVLAWLYLPHGTSPGLLETIVRRGKAVSEASKFAAQNNDTESMDGTGNRGQVTQAFLKPLSRGAMVMLTKTLTTLEQMLRGEDDAKAVTEKI